MEHDPLGARVRRQVATRTDTPETMDSLNALARHSDVPAVGVNDKPRWGQNPNTAHARAQLRENLEIRGLHLAKRFILDFGELKDRVDGVQSSVEALSTRCGAVLGRLSAAEKNTEALSRSVRSIEKEKAAVQGRLASVESFLSKYSLTSAQEVALAAGPGPGEDGMAFLSALRRVREIRRDCKSLVTADDRSGGDGNGFSAVGESEGKDADEEKEKKAKGVPFVASPATGFEILESISLREEKAMQVLFAWTQQQLSRRRKSSRARSSLPLASPTLRHALSLLSSRPAFFSHCCADLVRYRRRRLRRLFRKALTGTADPVSLIDGVVVDDNGDEDDEDEDDEDDNDEEDDEAERGGRGEDGTGAIQSDRGGGGSDNGNDDDEGWLTVSNPIDLHAHDPVRYTGDMLAWVHQALAAEGEAIAALLSPPFPLECDIDNDVDGKALAGEGIEQRAAAVSGSVGWRFVVARWSAGAILRDVMGSLRSPLVKRMRTVLSVHAVGATAVRGGAAMGAMGTVAKGAEAARREKLRVQAAFSRAATRTDGEERTRYSQEPSTGGGGLLSWLTGSSPAPTPATPSSFSSSSSTSLPTSSVERISKASERGGDVNVTARALSGLNAVSSFRLVNLLRFYRELMAELLTPKGIQERERKTRERRERGRASSSSSSTASISHRDAWGSARNSVTDEEEAGGAGAQGGALLRAVSSLAEEAQALFEAFLRGRAERLLELSVGGANHGGNLSGRGHNSSGAIIHGVSVCDAALDTVAVVSELCAVHESSMTKSRDGGKASTTKETSGEEDAGEDAGFKSGHSDTSDDFSITIGALLSPLEHALQAMAEEIPRGTGGAAGADGSIFLINNLTAVRHRLTKHACAAAWVQRLTSKIEENLEIAAAAEARVFLARCGLGPVAAMCQKGDSGCVTETVSVDDISQALAAFRTLLRALHTPRFDFIESPRQREEARRTAASQIARAYAQVHILKPELCEMTPPQVRALLDCE